MSHVKLLAYVLGKGRHVSSHGWRRVERKSILCRNPDFKSTDTREWQEFTAEGNPPSPAPCGLSSSRAIWIGTKHCFLLDPNVPTGTNALLKRILLPPAWGAARVCRPVFAVVSAPTSCGPRCLNSWILTAPWVMKCTVPRRTRPTTAWKPSCANEGSEAQRNLRRT